MLRYALIFLHGRDDIRILHSGVQLKAPPRSDIAAWNALWKAAGGTDDYDPKTRSEHMELVYIDKADTLLPVELQAQLSDTALETLQRMSGNAGNWKWRWAGTTKNPEACSYLVAPDGQHHVIDTVRGIDPLLARMIVDALNKPDTGYSAATTE